MGVYWDLWGVLCSGDTLTWRIDTYLGFAPWSVLLPEEPAIRSSNASKFLCSDICPCERTILTILWYRVWAPLSKIRDASVFAWSGCVENIVMAMMCTLRANVRRSSFSA